MLLLSAALLLTTPQSDVARWERMIRAGEPASACTEAEAAGNPAALNLAAWCYDTGTGVSRDQARAAALYLRAARAGNAEAQWRYGVMLDTGEGGVTRDPAAALDWFLKAARQGSTNAWVSLGVMYSNGRGVPVDHEKALAAYREAARLGNREALWHVGVIHFQGEGVPANRIEGAAWVIASATGGSPRARDIARQILPTLSEAERVDVLLRARAIVAEHGIDADAGTPPRP